MKLIFTKLETPTSEIKIAFDGINYKSYKVDDIKDADYIQFTEEDCPDLTKVKIQGKFSTLGSVEVNRLIEPERDDISITEDTTLGKLSIIDENGVFGFRGHVTIPESITSIGSYAFCKCSGLTSVNIPNSITEIGSCIFYHCSGLTSVSIPNNVTTIGSHAFSGCTSLTNITIPDSVTEIGSNVFYKCTSLTSITIPEAVTKIRYGVLSGCTSLRTINYKGTEKQWQAISKEFWDRDFPSGCVVNCNYKPE